MKKSLIAIFFLGIMILLISGCGCKGHEGTCQEESILSMLKNDDSPEFVLDGCYYSLPVNASELLDNGWIMWTDEYAQTVLEPNEYKSVIFEKKDAKLEFDAFVANDKSIPLRIDCCNVVEIKLSVYHDTVSNSNFFVTKYGIMPTTPTKEVRSILKDKDGFEEQSGRCYLYADNGSEEIEILYFNNINGHTLIRIGSAPDFKYQRHE